MSDRRRWLLLLAVALPLGLARITLPGLSDPSEGRYAEIAREMVESGDWIVPHWYGVPHLEKPPVAYWAAAAGIAVFGRSEFAVRLGALLSLLATAFFTAGIARRCKGERAALPAAATILVAPYALMVGAGCLADPFLLLATTAFHHAVVRRLHDGNRRALTMAMLWLGVGFLAKGYVVFLVTLVPLGLARTGVFKELWRLRRILVLLLVTVPWFLVVQLRMPGFLHEEVGRLGDYASGRGHQAPVYVYVAVILVGLFPFSLFTLRGLERLDRPYARLLATWILVPLVVFTLVPTRQWTYILPVVPAVAVLAGGGLARLSSPPRPLLGAIACLVGGLGLAAAAWLAPAETHVGRVAPAVVSVGAALVICAGWLLAGRRLDARAVAVGVAALVTAGLVVAAYRNEEPFKINRRLATRVEQLAGERQPVVLLSARAPSLAFYASRPVNVVGEGVRLAREAQLWGSSPRFVPCEDPETVLARDPGAVVVLPERLRAAAVPERGALARQGELSVIRSPGRPEDRTPGSFHPPP